MFSKLVHQTIELVCLLLTAFFLPVSATMLTVISIVMSVNWVAEADFRTKIKTLSSRRNVLILLLLFVMFIVWLINTSDFIGALHEFRLKLPLLAFIVIIGSNTALGKNEFKMIMLAFICGCIVSVTAGFLALGGIIQTDIRTSRDLALFIPSIRLSLFLNFAIFTALWMIIFSRNESLAMRIALIISVLAMTLFLFRLLSVTGIIIFIILLGATGLILFTAYGKRVVGASLFVTSVLITAGTVYIMVDTWRGLTQPANPSVNTPLQSTPSGNPYTHYPEETLVENGYLVWINVCEDELRQEWNKRSETDYDTVDLYGNEIRTTLIRYLTFLGMVKDSSAVAGLTADDISNIENGFANPLYARPNDVRAKAYELCWQIDRARKGGNPSGHSLTQRLEYYRAAAGIIKKNPLFGVGTGDVWKSFREEYKISNSPLADDFQKISHNQYLGFAVTFGIPGMLIALAVMLIPWLRSPNRRFYPFVIFIMIIFLSMFNDDTFHSSAGATFFSYFYTLFLVSVNENETFF